MSGIRALRRALIALIALAPAAAGQQQGWTLVSGAPQGWVGISADWSVIQEGRAHRTIVVVTEVAPGSPAERAGCSQGDSIVAINGDRLTLERWVDFRESLRPGDEVRLTLQRNGRLREVLMDAGEKEAGSLNWSFSLPSAITVVADSLIASITERFSETAKKLEAEPGFLTVLLQGDSTRGTTIQLVEDARREFAYSVRTNTGSGASAAREPERLRVVPANPPAAAEANRTRIAPGTARYTKITPVTAMPFELLSLRTPEADSLKGQYVQLRSELARIQQAQRTREVELRQEIRRATKEAASQDRVLSSLDGRNRRLVEELVLVENRLRSLRERQRESRENRGSPDRLHRPAEAPVGGRTPPQLDVTTVPVPAQAPDAPSASRDRATFTMSAHLVGRAWVAGAQLTSLNAKLSESFGVTEGVLVMEVLDRTPASTAGLLPGDVITRAGRVTVTDVASFRKALSDGQSGLRVRILRNGKRRTLRLKE